VIRCGRNVPPHVSHPSDGADLPPLLDAFSSQSQREYCTVVQYLMSGGSHGLPASWSHPESRPNTSIKQSKMFRIRTPKEGKQRPNTCVLRRRAARGGRGGDVMATSVSEVSRKKVDILAVGCSFRFRHPFFSILREPSLRCMLHTYEGASSSSSTITGPGCSVYAS
jgi:hypothetical protein